MTLLPWDSWAGCCARSTTEANEDFMAPVEPPPSSFLKPSRSEDAISAVVRQARAELNFVTQYPDDAQDDRRGPQDDLRTPQLQCEQRSPQLNTAVSESSPHHIVAGDLWQTEPITAWHTVIPSQNSFLYNSRSSSSSAQPGSPMHATTGRHSPAGRSSAVASTMLSPAGRSTACAPTTSVRRAGPQKLLSATPQVSIATPQVWQTASPLVNSRLSPSYQDPLLGPGAQASAPGKQQTQQRAYTPPRVQSARPYSPLMPPTEYSVVTPVSKLASVQEPRVLAFGDYSHTPAAKESNAVSPREPHKLNRTSEDPQVASTSSSFVLTKGPESSDVV